MQNKVIRCSQGRAWRAVGVLVSVGLLAAMQPVAAAPLVQQVSGTMDHKATITINGSGFGTKANAAPVAWDDASSGTSILGKWDGAWPSRLPGYNTDYVSPMRGVSPPHSHDTRLIAGAHAASLAGDAGYDVVFWKNITLQPFPFNVYVSWYQRSDSNWTFAAINNIKNFSYSVCCNPYELPNDWHLIYGPPKPDSKTDTGLQWVIADNGDSLQNPDANGHNAWWGHAVNPTAGTWSKVEVAIKVTNQTNGYVKVWENGQQVMSYVGSTDKYAGNQRSIGIGGYSAVQTTQNWRYFADAYLDTTLARVVLANNPTLANATIVENQIPSSWSNTSITATVNLGRFTTGQTAYLFVVDSTGTPNATGLTVTAGGAGSSSGAPNPPTAVAVQ